MPAVWNPQANALFLQVLEQPPAEREAFLLRACGDDAALAEQVRSLLAASDQAGSFLESPATAVANISDTARKTAVEPPALDFLSPSTDAQSLGRLGHYEVQEVIGSGGMGIVLRAFDERLHRVVAIKVMAAPLATHAASRKRFLREARTAAAVCHDHIVTIHAVEESNDLPYLVMQCVSGMSLQQRIDRDGPLALHEILRIGMQTAAGLAAAHAQGLIHRDIKPANILLENGVERVKITDFGLARAAADASITQGEIVAGTPQYMAPEQARGEALDYRTDLFSLGSVLYAMCTGRAPFRAGNSMAVLKRVCEDAPSPIREANADVPEWLIALIDKLQAKDPNDRYQSAAEVADILGQHLAQLQHSAPLPTLASPKSAPDRRAPRRQRTWAAAAAILLLLAATFGLAEGTGATKVAATVIRLFTPEGILIVETDDPGVKVTIEGDGGLVITGAGPQEVRVRPGKYTVRASKGGKPVKEELVTISRGGKETVRVHREPHAPVAATETITGGEIRRIDHGPAVVSLAVSRNGRRALFGGVDSAVWLVDLTGAAKPRAFEGHAETITSVAFSPDGLRALSGSYDGTVRLWNVESGKEIRQFKRHAEIVWCVAFSPDGRRAASGGGGKWKDGQIPRAKDTDVRLWNVESAEEIRRFTGHKDYVISVAFSPNGQRALTGCGNADHAIRIWDVESGQETGRLEGHALGVHRLVFAADGRRALSASADRTIRLWDTETREVLGRFNGHTSDVTDVAFSPSGRYLVSSSWDRTVRVWDVNSQSEVHRFEGHTGSIRAVAFSPSGSGVLSGAEDGTVRFWQLPEDLAQKARDSEQHE